MRMNFTRHQKKLDIRDKKIGIGDILLMNRHIQYNKMDIMSSMSMVRKVETQAGFLADKVERPVLLYF